MKFVTAILLSFSLLNTGLLLAQQSTPCACKNCKCTAQSHCGCRSDRGCTCRGNCSCCNGCCDDHLLSFGFHHGNADEHAGEELT
jgi:hypothetical protein